MKPPELGAALTAGWNAFKANAVPLIIITIVGGICMCIPILGWVVLPGFMYAHLKAVRGQAPAIGDLFMGFSRLVDYLVAGLLMIVGFIVCFIPGLVTYPLFYQGALLVADKNMTWGQAKDRCMAEIKPNLVPWIIFVIVCMIVGGLGSVLFGIGALITQPIAMCALAYAYDKTLGGGGGASQPVKA